MRYPVFKAATVFAAYCILLQSTALAQKGRIDPIVTVIDADGDGSVSSTELKSAAASIRKLDADNDGVVSLIEVSGKSNSSGGRGGGRPHGLLGPRRGDASDPCS